MKAGSYAAALELLLAIDQHRVLSSVGRSTEYDHEKVRSAMARFDGRRAPGSLQGAHRVAPDTPDRDIESTIQRYVRTGVWR